MRIVGGRFRGRRLVAPKGEGTRPTVDRVREAMASSVASACGGPVTGVVLDAFAGSGALGLEMVSRGASGCTFFERDRAARQALVSNVRTLGLSRDEARIVGADVMAAAASGRVPGGPFSALMLDPPYRVPASRVARLVADLSSHGLLAEGCVIVYEHRDGDLDAGLLPGELAGRALELHGQRHYGIVGVTIARLW